MSWLLVFLLMLGLHILEDFHIQGKMAEMKQKAFWRPYCEERPGLYEKDYLVVLLLHGMGWSIMVSLPLLWLFFPDLPPVLFCAIVVNGLLHAYIDDLKANKLEINLIQDQTAHMVQILAIMALAWVIL